MITNDEFNLICKESLLSDTEALEYVSNRKISLDTINTFDLGYCPDPLKPVIKNSDKEWMLHRLVFPIRDTYGEIVAFTGRSIDGRHPKYKNTAYNKSNYFYNLDKAKYQIINMGFAVLVEGNMDAVSLYMAGVQNVIALCGVALKPHRIALLSRYTDKVVFMLDNDKTGREATAKLTPLLVDSGITVRDMYLGKYKDADEVLASGDAGKFLYKIMNCFNEDEDTDIVELQEKLDSI